MEGEPPTGRTPRGDRRDPAEPGDADSLRRVVAAARTAAFWLSILLPLAYLPVLYVGVGIPEHLAAFVGLLVVHLCSLSLGHDHRPR
jgi:hypothetical protein